MTITTNANALRGEPAPLYRHYSGQTNPQPAWLYIMPEDERVEACYNPEIGNAVPMYVWHRRHITLPLPNTLKGDAIADWLESEPVQALLTRICDGHDVEWDGNNHVGTLTDDAEAALEALQRDIEEGWVDDDHAQVWSAEAWLESAIVWAEDNTSASIVEYAITRETTDDELEAWTSVVDEHIITTETPDEDLEAWADTLEAEAERDGIYIYDSVEACLTNIRDNLSPKDEDEA